MNFTAYPSGAPEFIPGFSGVRVTRSFVLSVCLYVDLCPFVLFLLTIVLSFPFRFMDSNYPFGIFKLFLNISMFKFEYYLLVV